MTEREVEELILLKRKIDELLVRYEKMQQELDNERSEKEKLKKLIFDREEEIEKLEKEYNKLQLSGAIKGDDENSLFARKRINNLVREIDKCIALLNNI